jgi:hypothetical protein
MRVDRMGIIEEISIKDIKEDVVILEAIIFKEEGEEISNLVMMTQTDLLH